MDVLPFSLCMPRLRAYCPHSPANNDLNPFTTNPATNAETQSTQVVQGAQSQQTQKGLLKMQK
jgi:hypothetical protein